MKLPISVVICTHNPKASYLKRVIDALKHQTLSLDQWELLLVDNASINQLGKEHTFDWHPNAFIIREDNLGLIHARLCGIKNTNSEVIVFVDDDNILSSNYLETVLEISEKYPAIGAWSGQVFGEFEETPPDWAKPYLKYLALSEFDRDFVSKNFHEFEVIPVGAGACYRRAVVNAYSQLVENDPRRLMLGRKGSSLASGEDFDMAFSSHDIGLQTGLFTSLKLQHLIPASRLTEEYFVRLLSSAQYTDLILWYLRKDMNSIPQWKHILRIILRNIPWITVNPKIWRMNRLDRRFYLAKKKGSIEAMIRIFDLQNSIEIKSNT
jgi:glycosyltransferase involved in cell wall biosynthesis